MIANIPAANIPAADMLRRIITLPQTVRRRITIQNPVIESLLFFCQTERNCFVGQ
jgi:hypothetical protein